ncbi:MAG: hypothetical protein MR742_12875 [Clostridiales bacterium]|nr:hypothetical protein [Clostridiales bacterium]
MQSSAIRPERSRLFAAVAGLLVLTGLMAFFPFACVGLALLTPLLGCPLAGSNRQWAAWLAAVAPAAVSLLYRIDPLYALSLLLPGVLPLVLTLWLKARKKLAAPLSIGLYIGAYALALTSVTLAAVHALGTGLAEGLALLLSSYVEASDQPGLLLYRFAAAGLLAVPEDYSGVLPLFLLEPSVIWQMLLSLRLNVQLMLEDALPWLFVQACLLGGLFTALRVQRLRCAVLVVGPDPEHPGERKARVVAPPGFRLMAIPPRLRWVLCLMALASLVLISAQSDLFQTLGLLFYAAFSCVFQLAGAAVLVCMLSTRNPDRTLLYGVLTALLYALFPMVLFFIGIADQALHFRSRLLTSTDSHKEG